MGWIGVDLDGTLALYDGWRGGEIGEPVPAMVERVKRWLAEGKDVRIFTARVGISGNEAPESQRRSEAEFAAQQTELIREWCERHIGQRLAVTATKDFGMIVLYDDRCRQVESNTGQLVCGDE